MKHKNVVPKSVPSPLATILDGFVRSPAITAPKRAGEIVALVAKHRIRIELNTSATSFAFAVHRDRRIRTSVRGLEHLWASLFAYHILYAITKRSPGILLDLTSTPDGAIAREFLMWTSGDPKVTWPTTLPRPSDTSDQNVLVANNLFTLSCGFIFLHEVGHVVLGHLNQIATNPQTKIRREYQADDWAFDFIVGGTDSADLDARLVAIAATLGVIGGVELYGEEGDQREHPYPPDRIKHFGEKVKTVGASKSTLIACLLAAGVPIQAHLLHKGVATMTAYETFEEFFDAAKKNYPS